MTVPRLDRASHLRKDTDRLMAALDAPGTLLVPVHRDQAFFVAGKPGEAFLPRVRDAGSLVDRATELCWLGLVGSDDCFAIDLSDLAAPLAEPALAGRAELHDLRMLGSLLPPEELDLLATARGLLQFHRRHQHCSSCGARTRPREGGHVRECEAEQLRHFPRTDPAVMVLVERDGRCVLARQPGWPAGMLSVIAGFVEPGESLEDCVAREVKEELGLEVTDITYARSQGWPFPASLMVGFTARALPGELVVDREELEQARWVSREELASPAGFFTPPAYSLAHRLLSEFLGRG